MTDQILPLRLKTQIFLNKFLEQKLNGFVLNYQKINYLISVHHHLPIDSVYNSNQKLVIKVDSCWSEVLIMETNNLDLSALTINYTIQNKLPKPGQIMFIKTEVQRYETIVFDYEFIPFDNINQNLLLPYIRSILPQNIENLSGLSGSPVFIDDKLIGVFSKFDVKESIAYIIPIYIIIKNLIKRDNTNIYGLPINKINKINSYNIKDNFVYHPTLKISIPVSTFLMLEGDLKSKFSVRHDTTNIMISHMIAKPIKINISNENFIVNKDIEYKINSRLLVLLKNFNVNKQIIVCLFNHISKNSHLNTPLSFSIVDNKIKLF